MSEYLEEELILLSNEDRQELIEERKRELNEPYIDFEERLIDRINEMKADAEGDTKLIIAINQVTQREYDQFVNYPLYGFDSLIARANSVQNLIDNGIRVNKDNIVLEGKRTVYLKVEVDKVAINADATILTNAERIEKAVEEFEDEGIEYELLIYINTTNYNKYREMVKDLNETTSRPYRLVSIMPQDDFLTPDIHVVSSLAPVSIKEYYDNFFGVTGLFTKRNKEIYLDYTKTTPVKGLEILDFLALAQSKLPNLITGKIESSAIADYITRTWLKAPVDYKFKHEEIEDFFNCPSVVLVRGVSPFVGVITLKKLVVTGKIINLETKQEEGASFEVYNADHIFAALDERELREALLINSENTRARLIKFGDVLIRVENMERVFTINGINLNNRLVKKFTTTMIDASSPNIVFISKYYRNDYFPQLKMVAEKYNKFVPFSLPPRMKQYAIRKAAMKDETITGLEDNWFSHMNTALEPLLSDLGNYINLETVLNTSISAYHGILNREIILEGEDVNDE